MSKIINLNAPIGTRETLKELGVTWVCSIPQTVFDSHWLLGCSNVPQKLPEGVSKIEGGFRPYLQYVNEDKKLELQNAMIASCTEKS